MKSEKTRFFIAGTDTNVGKTVIAAGLVHALGSTYFKPVQSGTTESDDSETVRQLAALTPERILSPVYRFSAPLSPHEAAMEAGTMIEPERIQLPDVPGALVVEGAGGLFVPLTDNCYMLDIMARFGLPVVLVARSTLGTINHTLLSVVALQQRGLTLAAVILNGANQPETERFLREQLAPVPVIGIPQYAQLTRHAMQDIAERLKIITTAV